METTLDLHPQPRIDVHLPLVGRHWRQHPNQHHRRTRSTALGPLPSLATP